MRHQVFEPFFRLEPSRNCEIGGTGQGLAVTRAVIHRHGGEITLYPRDDGSLVAAVILAVNVP